jgi:hypothetical protein
VQESGLAHAAHGLDAAADLHRRARGLEFTGVLRAVGGEDGGDGVREVVAGAVRFPAQRLNLFQRRKTLFQKLLFERQSILPEPIIIMDA